MKNCKEIAIEWEVPIRTVNDWCKKGKIPGAIKVGRDWQIPDDAVRPIDGRVSSGKYVKKKNGSTRSLPIGISDYIRAQAEYYYVDKTLLIKEFLDQKPLVSLFTRPRRFGKTLNMDMLRVFFEISDEDTSQYFVDKAIWKCGEEYRKHQGKYPVIFLTFKDVKFDSWEETVVKIRGLLQKEFGRHQELLNSSELAEYEKAYFAKVLKAEASEVEMSEALERLSQMLAKHYGKAPIIIIDEYDTPIQEGYSKDFYDEIIGFMRNFFSGAFKDNMSYDIYLRDPVTGETAEVPGHLMVGGTFQADYHPETGTFTPALNTEAHLNITYNYGSYYYEAAEENGIRSIYGMNGGDSIAVLEKMIKILETKYKVNEGWIYTKRDKTIYLDENGNVVKDPLDKFMRELPVEKKKITVNRYEGPCRDYWEPTAANAIKPLYQLIALAKMRPDCIWDGD